MFGTSDATTVVGVGGTAVAALAANQEFGSSSSSNTTSSSNLKRGLPDGGKLGWLSVQAENDTPSFITCIFF